MSRETLGPFDRSHLGLAPLYWFFRSLWARNSIPQWRRDRPAGEGPVALGIVAGLAGARVAGRLLETLLYGVSSRDPLTLAIVPVLLAAIGLLATWLPGRRATRVDPTVALRHE